MQNTAQFRDDTLSITESLLVHPTHTGGIVAPGDPVLVGRVVGVAATGQSTSTPTLSTDKVTVAVRGIFSLAVSSVHNGIGFGETVFIDPTSAVLSDDLTDVPFGVSVDENTIAGGGSGTIKIRLFGATPGAIGADS